MKYFSINYDVDNQHLIGPELNHSMWMEEEDEYLVLLIRINTFLIPTFGI